MKIVAIVQARMGSSRLPGKVLLPLVDKSVLAHVIQRIQVCKNIDITVVATTTNPIDDAIVTEAKKYDIFCFRGSEKNVLERYYMAAQCYQADTIVRITSDCPLLDPELLDEMIESFKLLVEIDHNLDYLSNTLERSYPRGLDIEIFTYRALVKAYKQAVKPYQKEHVTPYIYEHPEYFVAENYRLKKEYAALDVDISNYRWTLDTKADLALIKKIYEALYCSNRIFKTSQVLDLMLEHPKLASINSHVRQKQMGDH